MPILTGPEFVGDFTGDTPGRILDGDLTAVLGDITWGTVDQYGVRVHLAGLTGWWDPAPTTGGIEQRSNADGGWVPPAFSAPRIIHATLRLRGSSWAHLNRTIAALSASIPRRALETLYVDDHGDLLQADVRQEGDVLISRYGAGAEMSIALVAPDPRRYGTELVRVPTGLPRFVGGLSLPLSVPVSVGASVVAGAISVTNDGNESTHPTFLIAGPTPPSSITHLGTGRTIRIPEAVAVGHTLVIDTATRQALLDGISPRLVTGAWFDYDPGRNDIAFGATTYDPAALLVSEHRSAWR